MHELSIAEGIIDVVTKTARTNSLNKIKTVRVAIGELAGVEIEALRFAWITARLDSVADSAELIIERPKGEAWCMDCAKTVPLPRYGEPCPFCGGYHLTATGGTELKVLEIVGED